MASGMARTQPCGFSQGRPLPSSFIAAAVTGVGQHRNQQLRLMQFAWIGSALVKPRPCSVAALSSARPTDTVEQLKYQKIFGDGRCLFRALAEGLAYNAGTSLSFDQQTQKADELRMRVHDALSHPKAEERYPMVVQSIIWDAGSVASYCRQLRSPSFWGGEPELVVLADVVKSPIRVYRPARELNVSAPGYIKIVSYGDDSEDGAKETCQTIKAEPVRLCYSGGSHYDLLLPQD